MVENRVSELAVIPRNTYHVVLSFVLDACHFHTEFKAWLQPYSTTRSAGAADIIALGQSIFPDRVM